MVISESDCGNSKNAEIDKDKVLAYNHVFIEQTSEEF